MKAVSTKLVGRRASDGKQIVEAVIVSDSTPEVLPETGAGIAGL